MGERKTAELKVRFDRRVRLQFHGAQVSSDAGLLAIRELDQALGLTEIAASVLVDTRTGSNVQHQQVGLFRQGVYSRLAGYEDTNDAERLALDPVMRTVVGQEARGKPAASTNTLSRFETDTLTQRENLGALARLNAMWVSRAMGHTRSWHIILDLDSSESPVHGEQEGATYNGYFKSVCYHPLFCFNHLGDCAGALLRPGHVHSAEKWRQVLVPIVRRYRDSGRRKYLRADGGFACPEVYRHWSLRSVQVKLIKIGAKVVHHARQVIFQMAEVAVSEELFEQILERIWALAPGDYDLTAAKNQRFCSCPGRTVSANCLQAVSAD